MKPTIIHVITELGSGGAERTLLRLVMASTQYRHVVVSLSSDGTLVPVLRAAGAEVRSLGMRRYMPSLTAVVRLAKIIRRERPIIMQTWLYHADLVGLIAARLAGFRPVAWNLRCSNMDLAKYRWSTRLVVKLLIWLSSLPDMIMVNSVAGRRWHAALGYRARQWEVVPNGVDTAVFHPDAKARQHWRHRLNVAENETLVGMIARRDPMKDHEGMLQAAAEAARSRAGLVFVLAGRGITRNDATLARLADAVGAPVHLIDECDDPGGLNAALDIAVLSSAFGEGFPNVVAEAMATAVPCIVTDVGDAASIVGPTGVVVPPSDPQALAQAMLTLADDEPLRKRMGDAARRRIIEGYGLESAIARYEALWEHLTTGHQGANASGNFPEHPPERGLTSATDLSGDYAQGPNALRYAEASTVAAAGHTSIAPTATGASQPTVLKFIQRGLPAVVTVVALAAALSRFNYVDIWRTATALRPLALAIVLFALLLGNLLACLRLKVIAGDFHHPLRFRDAFAATVYGQLAGSFFFQIIGQTLARSAIFAKIGISLPATIVITGYERIVAATISLLIALLGALYLFGHITLDLAGGGEQLLEIFAGIVFVCVAGASFAWGKQAIWALRETPWHRIAATYFRASMVSVLVQATTMVAYLAAALGLSHNASLPNLAAAFTLVMFAASVPISLAGWGLREVSAVYALGAIGVPYEVSLVIALLIGFSSILIMAVLALASPLVARISPLRAVHQATPGATTFDSTFLMWLIPLFVASAVFFQIYVPVGLGKLNINLADSVVLFGGVLFIRSVLSGNIGLSTSRVPRIGLFAGLTTAVIVFAFLHGWLVDGWTAWASTNRLFGWFVLLSYAGTGALLVQRENGDGLRILLRTFVASGLAIATFELLLLLAVALGVDVPRELLDFRIDGFAQNPNAFGFQILLVVATIVSLRLSGWRHQAAMALAIMALYFTASRAAEGTCIVVFASAVALRYVSLRSLAISLACAAAGVAAILLIGQLTVLVAGSAHGFLKGYVETNVLQTTNISPNFKSNSERWLSLVAGVRMFLAHPIFGAGLGAFVTLFEREHQTFLIIHSTPLWLLAETGIVGFAIFGGWFAYVIVREIRASLAGDIDSARILLVLSLIAFGVMSQVHDLMYQRTFWFLLGAAIFSGHFPLKSLATKKQPAAA